MKKVALQLISFVNNQHRIMLKTIVLDFIKRGGSYVLINVKNFEIDDSISPRVIT